MAISALCYTSGGMLRRFPLSAAVPLTVLFSLIMSGCPRNGGGGYDAPRPPEQFTDSATEPYATVTGTLRGAGVLTLDGKNHSFEAIGKGRLTDSSAEYHQRPAVDARVVTIGGDFAGEAGLLEYPTGDNSGTIRVLLRGGEEPVPFALYIVIAKHRAAEKDIGRLSHLVNYYKGETLIERAAAALATGDYVNAEKFALQARDAAADSRRVNALLAKSLVKSGKRMEALEILSVAADEAKLDAAGFDLWLRLLDEQAKGAEGVAQIEKLLKAKKLDSATELAVRGSVYLRRLGKDARFADIKANLKRYIELVDEEEVDRSDLPIRRSAAAEMLARVEDVVAGKPSQLLEERFDKMPGADWAGADGAWKLTQAKGDSFITANPAKDAKSELFPAGAIGFTKDLRISMRVRLRDQAARLDIYPLYGEDTGFRLAVTNTWIRLYRAEPPLQSDLEAKLLAEKKLEDPLSEKWVSVTATVKNGTVSFAVNGSVTAEAKIPKPAPKGCPAIIVTGGVVDIDDLVVTSV